MTAATPWTDRLAPALRRIAARGYPMAHLRADLLAGTVVGVVALPLSMALAIASGVAPQHGLYTAIVAGFAIALLGGSGVQVSGPTAAFVAILVPIAGTFGLGGLLMATLMAGMMLVGMGALGWGRLIEFVPYPVTTGFTSGIAVVIATLQLRDLLGLAVVGRMPEHFPEKVAVLVEALPSARRDDAVVGALTLALLILFPRLTRRVPAPLVALTAAGVGVWVVTQAVPGFSVATIASRFSYVANGVTLPGIPRTLPLPALPWHLPGPDGRPLALSFDLVRELLPSAFAIAMLGAIESLLSAVVADGMTGEKHDPDGELIAQGIGNIVAPFFGGIAATGALARTATNVRSGGRTPVSAAFHALFVLLAVLLLAPVLGHLPMASMAALLLLVAWNMGEWRHFVELVRTAPRADVAVLFTCFGLTVAFDMVVSVTVGIMLASLLFMQRMADVTGARLVGEDHPGLAEPLPRGALLYEIAGPLFFGAAQKAMAAMETVDERHVRVVILDLRPVPAIDATGLAALQATINRLNRQDVKVVLAGVQDQPMRAFARARWRNRRGRLRIFRDFDRGVERARAHVLSPHPPAD